VSLRVRVPLRVYIQRRARARARSPESAVCRFEETFQIRARAHARYFEMVSFRDSEQRNAPRRGMARPTPSRLG